MAASPGMRKLAAALLASLIITLAAAGPAGAQNLHNPKRIPGVGELFVLRASGGELERVRAGVFELVLRRPTSLVTAFSDRPARLTREQRLRSFVSSWSSLGFRADPPNAALSIAGAPNARDVLVLEISRPLHFGDYGGMPLKIIWVLLDVATIAVLGSGLYLWLARRRLPAAGRGRAASERGSTLLPSQRAAE